MNGIKWQTTLVLLSVLSSSCSKMKFQDASSVNQQKLLNASSIVINGGALYTKSASVTLSLQTAIADEMYITNEPDCQNGGEWEPFAKTKNWQLAQTNQTGIVYSQFRVGKLLSDCVSDSIIHDDIPPQITLNAPPPKFIEGASEHLLIEVIENGSGIQAVNCKVNETTVVCQSKSDLDLSIIKAEANPLSNHYTYLISASDKAGNESQVSTVQFKVLPQTISQTQPHTVTATSNAPDVLFVVDNSSGTMNYQFNKNFDDGFGSLQNHFTGLDWQAAVITTDPAPTTQTNQLRDGQLVAFPNVSPALYILNQTITNGSTLFANMMDFLFQNRSQAKQEGITSAIRSIERSSSGINSTFFRSNSHLAIVVYSDQDETLEAGETADQRIAQINQTIDTTFGTAKNFSFYSIIRLPGDTTCNQNGNKPGFIYDQLAQQSGGFSENICAPDFSQVMGRIGRDISDKILNIALKCAPYFDAEEMTAALVFKKDGIVQNVNYTLNGSIVKLGSLLAPGNYTIEYSCLAP